MMRRGLKKRLSINHILAAQHNESQNPEKDPCPEKGLCVLAALGSEVRGGSRYFESTGASAQGAELCDERESPLSLLQARSIAQSVARIAVAVVVKSFFMSASVPAFCSSLPQAYT